MKTNESGGVCVCLGRGAGGGLAGVVVGGMFFLGSVERREKKTTQSQDIKTSATRVSYLQTERRWRVWGHRGTSPCR